MSIDTVDDLHSAEDMICVAASHLEAAFADVHLFHAREPAETCERAACVRLRAAIAQVKGYCRPSCYQDAPGEPWECDDDCGCPGDHDASHDDR